METMAKSEVSSSEGAASLSAQPGRQAVAVWFRAFRV